jgi:hypothetical protein
MPNSLSVCREEGEASISICGERSGANVRDNGRDIPLAEGAKRIYDDGDCVKAGGSSHRNTGLQTRKGVPPKGAVIFLLCGVSPVSSQYLVFRSQCVDRCLTVACKQ